jgi:hypothetical protein
MWFRIQNKLKAKFERRHKVVSGVVKCNKKVNSRKLGGSLVEQKKAVSRLPSLMNLIT